MNPSLPIEPTPSPRDIRSPRPPIERPEIFATLLWLTLAFNLATLPWLLLTALSPSDSPANTPLRFTTDINNAPASELSLLPGIGHELANRIIIDRTTRGPFRSADDLTRVPGIGTKKLLEAAPMITCGPPQNHPQG